MNYFHSPVLWHGLTTVPLDVTEGLTKTLMRLATMKCGGVRRPRHSAVD